MSEQDLKGLSFPDLLALIVKDYPLVEQVVRDILDLLAKQSPPRPLMKGAAATCCDDVCCCVDEALAAQVEALAHLIHLKQSCQPCEPCHE